MPVSEANIRDPISLVKTFYLTCHDLVKGTQSHEYTLLSLLSSMFIAYLNIPAPLVLVEVICDLPEQEITVDDRFLVGTRAAAVGFAGLKKA